MLLIFIIVVGIAAFFWISKLKAKNTKSLETKTTTKTFTIDKIRELPWLEIERLIIKLYQQNGFTVARFESEDPDDNVDLVATKEQWILLVQYKQWQVCEIGDESVGSLLKLLFSNNAQEGVIFTCGQFTSEAKEFAEGKPVSLVEGRELIRWLESIENPDSPTENKLDTPLPAPPVDVDSDSLYVTQPPSNSPPNTTHQFQHTIKGDNPSPALPVAVSSGQSNIVQQPISLPVEVTLLPSPKIQSDILTPVLPIAVALSQPSSVQIPNSIPAPSSTDPVSRGALQFHIKTKVSFFSQAEKDFFALASPIAADLNLYILPKIGLTDIFKATPDADRSEYNLYCQQHVNYVLITQQDYHLVAGIQLNDNNHGTTKKHAREVKKEVFFSAANFPLLRFSSKTSSDEIRHQFTALLKQQVSPVESLNH